MNELDKIQGGKKSLKTIFKSNKETENYGQTLQKNIDNQISQYNLQMDLNACIDYHLIQQILPGFHK